jgi:hypothetical protein
MKNKNSGNKFKDAKLGKILKNGKRPVIAWVKTFLSENDALLLEYELVKTFGKKIDNTGLLCNICDGGLATPNLKGKDNPMYGVRHSDALIAQIQEKIKVTIAARPAHKTEQWRHNIRTTSRALAKSTKIFNRFFMEPRPPTEQQQNDYKILVAEKRRIHATKQAMYNKLFIDAIPVSYKKQRQIEMLSIRNSGEGNPMFGKGYKLVGSKNGRALNTLVRIADLCFICRGTYKHFSISFMTFYKSNDPVRCTKFANRYNVSVTTAVSEIPDAAINFTDINSFKGYEHYDFAKSSRRSDRKDRKYQTSV